MNKELKGALTFQSGTPFLPKWKKKNVKAQNDKASPETVHTYLLEAMVTGIRNEYRR